jgi:hypothetical protein
VGAQSDEHVEPLRVVRRPRLQRIENDHARRRRDEGERLLEAVGLRTVLEAPDPVGLCEDVINASVDPAFSNESRISLVGIEPVYGAVGHLQPSGLAPGPVLGGLTGELRGRRALARAGGAHDQGQGAALDPAEQVVDPRALDVVDDDRRDPGTVDEAVSPRAWRGRSGGCMRQSGHEAEMRRDRARRRRAWRRRRLRMPHGRPATRRGGRR